MLTFDQQSQQNFLKSLFGNKANWITPLVVLVTLAFVFLGYFFYSKRTPLSNEPLINEIEQLYRWANKRGIETDVTLTPLQNIANIKKQKPHLSSELAKFEQIIIEVRYQQLAFTQKRKTTARVLLNSLKTAK